MASRSVNMYLGLFGSAMIVSTKEVYSYKTPASFGSIPSSVNMNDVSFSKLNMGMWRLVWQARNQDFIWGGANETKVDQTTEMYILLSDPFI